MAGLIILGTRPEAIKLIPLIKKALENHLSLVIVSTDQHEDVMTRIFDEHNLKIDFRLKGRHLSNLNEQLSFYLSELSSLFKNMSFDYVITQGDTLSAYSGMLFAYFNKIDFLYVESGLRTLDLMNPFPEEGLRVMMSHVAKMNFVPTKFEKENLEKENIDNNKIMVVGNTGIDYIMEYTHRSQRENTINTVLLTVHRRENWQHLEDFFIKLVEFAQVNPHLQINYPMHFNPNIQKLAIRILSDSDNIALYKPLETKEFYKHLVKAELIITDSGGVQEEASFLNKKIIVIRDKTERNYVDENTQIRSINDVSLFDVVSSMLNKKNSNHGFNQFYGDGNASARIAEWIIKEYSR